MPIGTTNDDFLNEQIEYVQSLRKMVFDGEISQEEFGDLIADAKNTIEIQEECSDMENKAKLLKSLDLMLTLV